MENNRSVLVTGASSGIGLSIDQKLSDEGMQVFAGVRKRSTTPKSSPLLREVVIDVTSEESIASAKLEIEQFTANAGMFALVNNAGIGDLMPLEFTPMERFRQVLEVDLLGVVAVTQAFLPLLHRAKGRIINIGSVGGMITIPFGASLTASKHAIESISDAFRLELYAAGIHVTCIQPASINSGSAEKLAQQTEQTIHSLPLEAQRRYGSQMKHFVNKMLRSETNGSPPAVVAQAVLDALRSSNPPARKLVGKDCHLLGFLARKVPDRMRDGFLRRLLLGNPGFGSNPAKASAE